MLTGRWCLAAAAAILLFTSGCGRSGLAAPFDRMGNQPITVLRLQNYEPPPAPGPAPSAPAQPTQTPQLPPQIQQWLSAGASMLPPGLIPPGLLTGQPGAPPAPPAPAPAEAQRFHGFRVLGWMALTDPKLREEVLDIFGDAKSFTESRGGACMYSEMGVSIGQPGGGPPADMLVSFSCDRVQAFNFAWPHAKAGLAPETVKRIVAVMTRSFGG
jgi:hypothetical protein